MLCDMEEKLLLIRNNISKELMKDSLKSYSVGILRGSIIFSYMAVIHHLKEGLKFIRDIQSSDIKPTIDKIVNEHEYFPEASMVEFLANTVRILNRQQTEFLRDLISKRNQCAHTSEFILTTEDARYLYNNSIELFLKYNIISGRETLRSFLNFIKDNRNIFFNKNIDQVSSIVSNHIDYKHEKFQTVLYKEINEFYTENINSSDIKNNIEKVIYIICRDNKETFSYFMQASLAKLAANECNFSRMLYNFLLRIDANQFIKEAEKNDQDNFLRIFPDLINKEYDIDSDIGTLHEILKTKIRGMDKRYVRKLISEDFSIAEENIFEEIYETLNEVNFNIIDRYIPKWIKGFNLLALILTNEECYKIYLRLIKSNILLWKESVMNMLSTSYYESIREKSKRFVECKNSNNIDVNYEAILFSSSSYYTHARNICDPKSSVINIWDEMIMDNDIIKLIYDEEISLSSYTKFHVIKEKINEIKEKTTYDEKKNILLAQINNEENYK